MLVLELERWARPMGTALGAAPAHTTRATARRARLPSCHGRQPGRASPAVGRHMPFQRCACTPHTGGDHWRGAAGTHNTLTILATPNFWRRGCRCACAHARTHAHTHTHTHTHTISLSLSLSACMCACVWVGGGMVGVLRESACWPVARRGQSTNTCIRTAASLQTCLFATGECACL